jgi:hypothetical protein
VVADVLAVVPDAVGVNGGGVGLTTVAGALPGPA